MGLTNDLFYVLIIYLNKYDFVTLSNEEKKWHYSNLYLYTFGLTMMEKNCL
jgi:hypothetical protein